MFASHKKVTPSAFLRLVDDWFWYVSGYSRHCTAMSDSYHFGRRYNIISHLLGYELMFISRVLFFEHVIRTTFDL